MRTGQPNDCGVPHQIMRMRLGLVKLVTDHSIALVLLWFSVACFGVHHLLGKSCPMVGRVSLYIVYCNFIYFPYWVLRTEICF